jgi:hypothetical protein
MSQMRLDLEAGERARDRGLAAAGRGEEWIERAAAVIRHRLAGQEVLAEVFRAVCIEAGIDPGKPNGWGALTMALAKRGLITDTGRSAKSRSPRSHARRQPVWRVAG